MPFDVNKMINDAKEFFSDLTQLEINTIVKADMTARKMPAPGLALCEIAFTYWRTLKDIEKKIKPGQKMGNDEEDDKIFEPSKDRTKNRIKNGICTFTVLGNRAGKYAEQTSRQDGESIILYRIEQNSERIIQILKSQALYSEPEYRMGYTAEKLKNLTSADKPLFGPQDFKPADMTAIRRIWDVGTETIALQTFVSLDGDVRTRVSQKYAKPEHAHMLEIHRAGMTTALATWGLLISTVVGLLGSLGVDLRKGGQ